MERSQWLEGRDFMEMGHLLPGHMLLNAFKASLRIVLSDIGQVEIEDMRSIRDFRLWNLDALRDCKKPDKSNLTDLITLREWCMKMRRWDAGDNNQNKQTNKLNSVWFSTTNKKDASKKTVSWIQSWPGRQIKPLVAKLGPRLYPEV